MHSKVVRWVIRGILPVVFVFMLLQIGDFAQAQEPGPLIHKLELASHEGEPPTYRALKKPAVILPLLQRAWSPVKQIYGYFPYWSSAAYLNYNLLTTIAYFGAEFDGSGNVVNRHGWPVWSLINTAHSHGVRVDLVAICFNKDKIHSILTNPVTRKRFIRNAVAEVKKGGADGLNVDFELPYSNDRDALSTFMAALTDSFHAAIPGSRVTIATTAVNWGGRFDRRALTAGSDGLMIMAYDYTWSGSSVTGPVSPLTGGTYNVTNTVNEYLTASDYQREKLILGVPYYGYEWKASSEKAHAPVLSFVGARLYSAAEPKAAQYGKLWDSVSQTPWYRFNDGTNWHQCWYDDSLSLSKKYKLALEKDLSGIGIWALGYDGSRTELWGDLRDHFISSVDSLPPFTPTHLAVRALGDYAISIRFKPVSKATGYLLFTSLDGVHYTNESGTLYADTLITLKKLIPDTVYYFRVKAVNTAGSSSWTEMLAATSAKSIPGILIVNGFDRLTGTQNTHDFIRQHGSSVWHFRIAFSSASNEAVEDGRIELDNYAAVDWILGEEGAGTESFGFAEQAKVKLFLRNGGNLFVSGSEIGYDLVEKGSPADQSFYTNYLKASYVSDRAGNVHSASGVNSGIMQGLDHINYDDGTHGGYDVDYPDGIKPAGGSTLMMVYDGVDYAQKGGAGVQYKGTFGGAAQTGKLVYMSFPFEMIYESGQRNQMMGRILTFFGADTVIRKTPKSVPGNFVLDQNYPNPVSIQNQQTTTIRFWIPEPAQVRVVLYDVLGRRVKTLFKGYVSSREYLFKVDLHALPAGTYFYRLQALNRQITRKLIIVH